MFPMAERIGALLIYPFGRTALQAAAALPSDENPSGYDCILCPEYHDLNDSAGIAVLAKYLRGIHR